MLEVCYQQFICYFKLRKQTVVILNCLLMQRPPKVSIGPPHPDPVVETSSLAAVQPPDPTYDPKSKDILESSKALSCLQIETLVYACQVSSLT